MDYLQLEHLIVMLLLNFVSSLQGRGEPIVDVPTLGRLRGSLMSSASGRMFDSFRAIPYALPPVGDLRFRVII